MLHDILNAMTFLTFFMITGLVAVLGALGYGLFAFIKGDSESENSAMRWRVLLQGIALFLFFLLLYFGRR